MRQMLTVFDINNLPELHFILVDACHCKSCVITQFNLYFPLLVERGIICFHDVYPPYQDTVMSEPHKAGAQVNVLEALSNLNLSDYEPVIELYDTNNPRGIKCYQKESATMSYIQDSWIHKDWVFVDIGELGWSLYLSAHLRWLNEPDISIITYKDRFALYKDYNTYPLRIPIPSIPQTAFGLRNVPDRTLKHLLQSQIKQIGKLAPYFTFDNCPYVRNHTKYIPYKSTVTINKEKRILIFPRYRSQFPFSKRNLNKEAWINITDYLNKFNYVTTLIGTSSGAYNLNNVEDNLIDDTSLQDIINICEESVLAIGSASSLPKLSLLQGVPTFIIGHEEERVINENWLDTRLGFQYTEDYNISYDEMYNNLNKFCEDIIHA